jgi:hypothetical protein
VPRPQEGSLKQGWSASRPADQGHSHGPHISLPAAPLPAPRSLQALRDAEAKARAAEAARKKDDDDDDSSPPSGGARGLAASLGAAALAMAGGAAPTREPALSGARAAAAAAAPPPPPRGKALAGGRAKESPGLALLAAGSILWNLLGPIGGVLVKVAQHPAATKAGARARA